MKSDEKVYQIRGKWSIYYTLNVSAESFEKARDKICDNWLLTEYCGSPATYGLDEYQMQELGIELVEEEHEGCPEPTGNSWTQRSWEWKEMCANASVCEEELTYDDSAADETLCSDCRTHDKGVENGT